MKLFISYARVDRPYCIQIVNTLEVHEVWYDQRLHAGQNWWKEILRRLEWCEGFIYLLSPESVTSEYCKKEYELARHLGRYIFPILIYPDTEIPDSIKDLQYVDFSGGLTAEAIKTLLNSIYLAENEKTARSTSNHSLNAESMKPPSINPISAISAATAAMTRGQFDHAVFLLKRAKASGHSSRFINIDAVLAEAEAGLQRQTYLREAEREYRQIVDLVKFDRTHKLGCEAFAEFHKHFADYDPDGLGALCAKTTAVVTPIAAPIVVTPQTQLQTATATEFKLPLLEWCEIPAGRVEIRVRAADNQEIKRTIEIPTFKISRYPITNAQYRFFVDDPLGYANPKWWQFSTSAQAWRAKNPEPAQPTFKGDERPRERVNWYDAMAFCNWLSIRADLKVSLPSEAQWIRAARGDDQRKFPWGDQYDSQRCNTSESEIRMTTLVMRYTNGVSPFGVYDMAGNVWEWCLDSSAEGSPNGSDTNNSKRLVHGGSFISPQQRAEIGFRYYLDPQNFHSTIGFRVVALDARG